MTAEEPPSSLLGRPHRTRLTVLASASCIHCPWTALSTLNRTVSSRQGLRRMHRRCPALCLTSASVSPACLSHNTAQPVQTKRGSHSSCARGRFWLAPSAEDRVLGKKLQTPRGVHSLNWPEAQAVLFPTCITVKSQSASLRTPSFPVGAVT